MKTKVNAINLQLVTWSSRVFKIVGFWLITIAVVAVCNSKLSQLREQSGDLPAGYVSAQERTQQLDCLTRNIYWEAASESFEGKVAVAQVTLNRVASGRFADTICGVVYQKNVVYQKVICQFSWFCEAGHRVKAVYTPLWKESEEVAKKVLLEGFRLPALKNALYFHGDYVRPGWKNEPIANIGRHIFYGDRK